NSGTARVYVALGLLTDDSEIASDVTDLFNVLTGIARKKAYRRLLVGPTGLRSGLADLIEGEILRQREHGDGRIVIKANAVVDPEMITHLYRASQAGVQIDLIVRGMVGLQPGIPGISETIRVRSIVG